MSYPVISTPTFRPFEFLPVQTQTQGLYELAVALETGLLGTHEDHVFFGELKNRILQLQHSQPGGPENRMAYQFNKAVLGQLVATVERLEAMR